MKLKRTFLVILSFCFAMLSVLPASAAEEVPSNGYNTHNNIIFWDARDEGALVCNPSGALPIGDTSDHVLAAFRFFMSQKDSEGNPMKDYMAAGIIGNLQQESGPGLQSDIGEGGGTQQRPTNVRGFGIAQWTYSDRQNALIKYVDDYNSANNTDKPYTDFVLQLGFVYHEMTTTFKESLPHITKTTDEVDAAVSFHDTYERSADSPAKVISVRGGNATRELAKFRANPGNDVPSGDAIPASAGNCGNSGADDSTGSGEYGAKIDGKCTASHVQITGEGDVGKVKPDVQLVVQCIDGYFTGYVDPYGTYAGAGGHGAGVAVDLMIPDYKSAAGRQKGWAMAKWLQSKKKELGIHYLIFADKIWNVERDSEGWRAYNPLAAAGSVNDSSRHLNHIHVETWGNKAVGMQ